MLLRVGCHVGVAQLHLDVEAAVLLPGLDEAHAVGVRGQALVLRHLLQLVLAVLHAAELPVSLLHRIPAPVLPASDLVDLAFVGGGSREHVAVRSQSPTFKRGKPSAPFSLWGTGIESAQKSVAILCTCPQKEKKPSAPFEEGLPQNRKPFPSLGNRLQDRAEISRNAWSLKGENLLHLSSFGEQTGIKTVHKLVTILSSKGKKLLHLSYFGEQASRLGIN